MVQCFIDQPETSQNSREGAWLEEENAQKGALTMRELREFGYDCLALGLPSVYKVKKMSGMNSDEFVERAANEHL